MSPPTHHMNTFAYSWDVTYVPQQPRFHGAGSTYKSFGCTCTMLKTRVRNGASALNHPHFLRFSGLMQWVTASV